MLGTEDARIIRRCLDSDPEAWEELVQTRADLVWSAIHRTFGLYNFSYGREDAEDLFNSVFLSLLEDDCRRLRQFRGDNKCSLSTWLTVVTGRKALDFMRKDRGRLTVEPAASEYDVWETISDGGPPADVVLAEKQARELLAGAVRELAPRDRIIYHLLFTRGCDATETARILGISQEVVHSRKHRIIQQLKKMICP